MKAITRYLTLLINKKYIISILVIFCSFCLGAIPRSIFASATGFDFPAGAPDGKGYSNGQQEGGSDGWGFLEWNGSIFHPGEDWNRGSGETDFGDPLYSISSGKVIRAADFGGGWGKVLLIEHNVGSSSVWSQYAHLSEISVKEGDYVVRGGRVGRIGNANGYFVSHLHFEVRKQNLKADFWPSGYSKERVSGNYYPPSDFINSHRPPRGQTLSAIANAGKIDLAWDKSTDPNFDHYEIYRTTVQNGTSDPTQRTLVASINNPETVTQADSPPNGATYYYRIFTIYKNGLIGQSDEVAIELKIEAIKITTNRDSQEHPTIDNGRVVWEDRGPDGLYKLNYYDIKAQKKGQVNINLNGAARAETPEISSDKAVFSAIDAYWLTGRNIYSYNFRTNLTTLITMANGEQITPVVSREGIVVWDDFRKRGDGDLYYLDLNKSDGEKLLVGGAGTQSIPRIWGKKVVWIDNRNGGSAIYFKEIDGAETKLANTKDGTAADIWENKVVWSDSGKVNLMDLDTKAVKVICSQGGATPRVKDGKVVYSKAENSFGYVHVYEIDTGKDIKIDTASYALVFPAVWENYVVFDAVTDKNQPTNKDIFLVAL